MTDPIFAAATLEKFAAGLLEASRVPAGKARLVAECLVDASLRGVDSHGVQLLTFYLHQLADGRVDADAEGRVVSETGAVMVYDGRNGLGQAISAVCSDHAVRLARDHGVGVVVSRESNHFGAAAVWGPRIAASGMIGIVFCNASPAVPPWQGKDPRWGTNPICVAVPGGAWLLDMATTTVAMGQIYKARLAGKDTIPPGWAMDGEGVPTTSVDSAIRGLLMPLGGYKGSGLAMMVEILCAVLSGGAIAQELGGLRIKDRPFRVSQFFLALDVARFLPLEEFERRMQDLVTQAKSARPAPGYDEVLVAGEAEWRAETERRRDGIPLSDGLWRDLCAWAERLGVEIPEAGV